MSLQMIRSRVFVFLSITLCLVTCCCANAEAGSGATKQAAEQAVIDLKGLTATVVRKAETKFTKAQSIKRTVESQKAKAERAESEAKAAAEAITAENRKTEAVAFAQKAKSELDVCLRLYQDANENAEQASSRMNGFLTRARNLDKKAQIEIPPAPVQPGAYAQVIENAKDVRTDTQRLSGEIDAAETLLNTADIALSTLKEGAQKVQVAKYQADFIRVFSSIETMLNEADDYIRSIEEKKDEINATVQAMNTVFENAPETSKGFLSSLCGNARGHLQTTSNKLIEANNCNKDMQGRKTQADESLATITAKIEEREAGTQVVNVVWHETFFKDELQKIKKALRTAETSVSSAKSQHRQMIEIISQNNRQSGSKPDKDNQQEDVPTAEVPTVIKYNGPAITNTDKKVVPKAATPTVITTDGPAIPKPAKQARTNTEKPTVIKNDGPAITDTDKPVIPNTENPVITETEKPIFGKSENSMDKTSDQPVDANLDNTETPKSTQLMHEEEQSPRDDNSELLNNDKLRNITKNITKHPLIDGEIPKWSAANDSAVTVSIPLLVALIVSAVFH